MTTESRLLRFYRQAGTDHRGRTLGDIRLRELSTPAEAREPVGDAGVLHELGVGALHLLAQAFAFDEIFDLGVGPGGRPGGQTAT